jgi:hypothetical protein
MTRATRAKVAFFHAYFLALIVISLRHLLIPGDVLWTDEGSVMDWHMLLRSQRCGFLLSHDGSPWEEPDLSRLSPAQRLHLSKPTLLLSFVRQTACTSGKEVRVKSICATSVNEAAPLIDEKMNICEASYHYLSHNDWITLAPGSPVSEAVRRARSREAIR